MRNNIKFINVLIKNSNELVQATHNYIKWQAPLDVKNMSREDVVRVSCEAMRVTIRITQIMGWLLLQKAVLEGELPRHNIPSDKRRILQGKTCLDSFSETDSQLPSRLRELLKASRELYLRIMRLEEISLTTLPLPEELKKKETKSYHAVPHLYIAKTHE